MRTKQEAFDLVANLMPSVTERYLDPKNALKGSYKESPFVTYRLIQKECLEAAQANRNSEGLHREREELADIVLFVAYRMKQIDEELAMEDDDAVFTEDLDELQEDEGLLFEEEDE